MAPEEVEIIERATPRVDAILHGDGDTAGVNKIAALEAERNEMREALEHCWINDDDTRPLEEWLQDVMTEARHQIAVRAGKENGNG